MCQLANPRAAPAEPKNPRTIANNSGSSSKNASWPLSVTISAKETRAELALSACTMARFRRWEQPITGKRHDTETGLGAAKRLRQDTVVVCREIEVVHRAGQ